MANPGELVRSPVPRLCAQAGPASNARGPRTITAVRPPVTVSASRRYTSGAFRVSSPHPRDYMDLEAPLFLLDPAAAIVPWAGRVSTGARTDEASRLRGLRATGGTAKARHTGPYRGVFGRGYPDKSCRTEQPAPRLSPRPIRSRW